MVPGTRETNLAHGISSTRSPILLSHYNFLFASKLSEENIVPTIAPGKSGRYMDRAIITVFTLFAKFDKTNRLAALLVDTVNLDLIIIITIII